MSQSTTNRRKVYVTGSRPDVQVPFAEVDLSNGDQAVRLYDTSGPGGDPEVGLPQLRAHWIRERDDVAEADAQGPANAGRRVL
ncbi:MAG TPA: phosphomethylpyrimidine synthase, partial [Micromonosporaceae bacterium]|nr:phosphomethylpyrimidine synthase [Micromonosporaceae bacterium]